MIKDQIRFYLENAKQIFSIKFVSVLVISFPSAIIADYFNIPIIALGKEIIRTEINLIENTCLVFSR